MGKKTRTILELKKGDPVWIINDGIYDYSHDVLVLYPSVRTARVSKIEQLSSSMIITVEEVDVKGASYYVPREYTIENKYNTADCAFASSEYKDSDYGDVYEGEDVYHFCLCCVPDKRIASVVLRTCYDKMNLSIKQKLDFYKKGIYFLKRHKGYVYNALEKEIAKLKAKQLDAKDIEENKKK